MYNWFFLRQILMRKTGCSKFACSDFLQDPIHVYILASSSTQPYSKIRVVHIFLSTLRFSSLLRKFICIVTNYVTISVNEKKPLNFKKEFRHLFCLLDACLKNVSSDDVPVCSRGPPHAEFQI